MDFGEVLVKAWKTIWKHKILWLFGVLAGCGAATSGGGGGGGGGTSSINLPSQSGNWGGQNYSPPMFFRTLEDFFQALADIPVWVWVLIAITLVMIVIVLSIVFLLLGTLGTTGVIKGASIADQAAPDDKPISFSEIFKEIKPYYWKVLLLNVGLRLVGFIVGLLLIIPVILLVVCTCFLGLLLLLPIGLFIEMMVNFTTIAIIEEGKGLFAAITRAWQVITRKLGNVVLMFLILGIGQFIIGLFIILPIMIVPIPLLTNLIVTGFQSFTVGLILSGVLLLLFVPLVVFLSGVLKAYVLTSWTLTYRRLTGDDALSPMVLSNEGDAA